MNTTSSDLNFIERFFLSILLRLSKRKALKFQQKLLFSSEGCYDEFSWDWNSTCFNRIAVVNFLISDIVGCKYLEIGCASNSLFSSIPLEEKIGVDPARGGTHRMTSDLFFSNNSRKFDCIFIDGLHTYDQVKTDLINSLTVLEYGGWIVIHDMLPRNWVEAHVPMITGGAWTGDVWKLAFDIVQSNDLDFRIIAIDHGVGVLRKKTPQAMLDTTHKDISIEKFKYLFDNISKLPVVNWKDFIQWKAQTFN
jgi:hypothetical protein